MLMAIPQKLTRRGLSSGREPLTEFHFLKVEFFPRVIRIVVGIETKPNSVGGGVINLPHATNACLVSCENALTIFTSNHLQTLISSA
jgi:hypothetical protein